MVQCVVKRPAAHPRLAGGRRPGDLRQGRLQFHPPQERSPGPHGHAEARGIQILRTRVPRMRALVFPTRAFRYDRLPHRGW